MNTVKKGIHDAGEKLTGQRKGDKQNKSGKFVYLKKDEVLKQAELPISPDFSKIRDAGGSPYVAKLLKRYWRGVPSSITMDVSESGFREKYGDNVVDSDLEIYREVVLSAYSFINATINEVSLINDYTPENIERIFDAVNYTRKKLRTLYSEASHYIHDERGMQAINVNSQLHRGISSVGYILSYSLRRPAGWVLSEKYEKMLWDKILPEKGSRARAGEVNIFAKRPKLAIDDFVYTGEIEVLDIEPEDWANTIVQTFGLKGIEFGDWNRQSERLEFVKQTYTGLMELASLLNIEPHQIGMGGRLGLAIGARGRGRANATFHSYPDGTGVINLTRTSGAGALAHEYGHAMDFFAMRDVQDMNNPAKDAVLSKISTASSHNVIDEEKQAASVVQDFSRSYMTYIRCPKQDGLDKPEVINGELPFLLVEDVPELYRRSRKLDKFKRPGYWSTPNEIWARRFETWVSDRLENKGVKHSFLVNGTKPSDYGISDDATNNPFPYPVGQERKDNDELMDILMTHPDWDMMSPRHRISSNMDMSM